MLSNRDCFKPPYTQNRDASRRNPIKGLLSSQELGSANFVGLHGENPRHSAPALYTDEGCVPFFALTGEDEMLL